MGTSSGPIDPFIGMNQPDPSENPSRLLFVNHDGELAERDIRTGAIEEILKVFDGNLRSVRRSSGGLSTVELCQVVMVANNASTEMSARIRVRFKDFAIERKNGLARLKTFTLTKIVPMEDLKEPFNFDFAESQQFVLDFGQGMVPIYVFHYGTDKNGVSNAFFTEFDQLERAIGATEQSEQRFQIYAIPKTVLRYASIRAENNDKSDYEIARDNLNRMRQNEECIVPSCLAVGAPIAISGPNDEMSLRRMLKSSLVTKKQKKASPSDRLTRGGHPGTRSLLRLR